MREKLVALAKLAQMDNGVRELDAELKAIPAQLDELRQSVQMLETLFSQERAQLSDAETLKVTRSAELKERVESLGRSRKKAAQATNMKEAQAGEREIEASRRLIKEREDELRRIGDAIEAKQASLAEREKDFDEAKQLLQSQEESSRARIAELEQERDKFLVGREDIVAQVPADVFKRYERLRGALATAVVIIGEGTCPGCRMALPPQLCIELQRGDEFHQCPNCRRMLVHRVLVGDEMAEAADAAAQAKDA